MYRRTGSRRSAERRALAWLRKLIHPYCWGTSDRFKQGFGRTTKAQILDFFLCLRLGLSRRWLPKPKTQEFMRLGARGRFLASHDSPSPTLFLGKWVVTQDY
jgi:hypothetical protein